MACSNSRHDTLARSGFPLHLENSGAEIEPGPRVGHRCDLCLRNMHCWETSAMAAIWRPPSRLSFRAHDNRPLHRTYPSRRLGRRTGTRKMTSGSETFPKRRSGRRTSAIACTVHGPQVSKISMTGRSNAIHGRPWTNLVVANYIHNGGGLRSAEYDALIRVVADVVVDA